MTERWPSTTEIIRAFGLMADYEGFSSTAAMRRGRLVTAACHLLAARESLGEGWEARHQECHPYLDAYRKFLREHHVELLEAETEFRCEAHRYVSHPDQIVLLDHGERPIDLELKSGSMPRWCQLQTAGQVIAAYDAVPRNHPALAPWFARGAPLMRRFALLLKPDGNYQLFSHEDYRDLDKFRSLVETWWTVQEFRPRLEVTV